MQRRRVVVAVLLTALTAVLFSLAAPSVAGAQNQPGVPGPPSGQAGGPGVGVQSNAEMLNSQIGVSPGLPYGVVDGTAAWDILDSGLDLASVDAASGALLGTDPRNSLTDAYMVAADLDSLNLANQQAQHAAEEARRRMLDKRKSRLPAGTPFAAEIEAAADAEGIDPALLAAVAETESGWNDDVIYCRRTSSAGARGLMQFMPATAASFGIDPCDPAQALRAGAKYLRQLHDQFGNWDLAIAAYNAGPGKVRAAGNQIPNIKETQNYVAKVNLRWLANAAAAAQGEASQTSVGPDGCPTSAPANTLRKGADRIGVYELCRNAVANARTPQAAAAIKIALGGELGLPYSQPRRNSPGYSDCSSFVTRAYQKAGVNISPPGQNAPTTASMVGGPRWSNKVSMAQVKGGDFVFTSAPGHVTMYLYDNWIVHTNRTGDISHVTKLWVANPPLILAVDPSRV